jgi:hypothetical protein
MCAVPERLHLSRKKAVQEFEKQMTSILAGIDLQPLIEALVGLFLALVIYLQTQLQKTATANSAAIQAAAVTNAATAATVKSMDTAQTVQMAVATPAAAQAAEVSVYRTMTDAAKKENMRGLDADQQKSFLAQVAFNEDAKNIRYQIVIPPLGYLVIENGCAIDDELDEPKVA